MTLNHQEFFKKLFSGLKKLGDRKNNCVFCWLQNKWLHCSALFDYSCNRDDEICTVEEHVQIYIQNSSESDVHE